MERTLVIIKPDGMERNIIGDVIKRFESADLRIVGLKMIKADLSLMKKHYPDSMIPILGEKSVKAGAKVKDVNKQGKKVLGWLRKFMMSSPVVAMVLQGENAVKKVRQIVGSTDPSEADVGTIRADYSNDSIAVANAENRTVRNIVHASGNPEEAKKEISIWFKDNEIFG
ncbi:MAG: nucleoside-diphosphate kinase [Candidatus Aenigmatarchaeota archaeon]|nr:MAG: nucleoside-diphosphate kinase [Candidatus Aenigmarchaeota archaeon]